MANLISNSLNVNINENEFYVRQGILSRFGSCNL